MKIHFLNNKINTLLFITLFYSVVAGCGVKKNSNNEIRLSNNFESVVGWAEQPSLGVKKGDARSGEYLCETDTNCRWSYYFKIGLDKITTKRISKITASIWTLKSSEYSVGDLVIEILNKDGKSISYNSSTSTDPVEINAHEWVKSEAFADITQKDLNNPENSVNIIYVNRGNDKIKLDDFEIVFE